MRHLFGKDEPDKAKRESGEGKLQLRKEELDISKDKMEIGEVEIRKEIIEELQSADVPVTHEEVIIERRAIDNEPSDSPIESAEETIRIPVSEERIEVGKHTVITGEVSAHKHEIEETKHVEDTLKREEARVDTEGDPNVVDEGSIDHLH